MSTIKHYLRLIEQRDHEGIESARDTVTPAEVKSLIVCYKKLVEGDWEGKACIVHLVQDQTSMATQLAPLMLDFLRAPAGPDDAIDTARAIALGFQGEEYDRFMVYYNDRDLLRKDAAKVLQAAGLTPWKPVAGNTPAAPAQTPHPADEIASLLNPDARLLAASERGLRGPAEKALDEGADIDTSHVQGTYKGCTPLLMAMIKGHLDIAWMLIERGADIQVQRWRSGQTALYWAAYRGEIALIRKLIELGANPNQKDGYGGNILQQAAQQNNPEVIRVLTSAGADVHGKYTDGRKPIAFAAEEGRTAVVAELIDCGNSPDEASSLGETPLMTAVGYGFADMVTMLIEKGADVNARSNGMYSLGMTPLMLAARGGYVKIARALLQAGADVSAVLRKPAAPGSLAADKGDEPVKRAVDFAVGKRARSMRKLLEDAGSAE